MEQSENQIMGKDLKPVVLDQKNAEPYGDQPKAKVPLIQMPDWLEESLGRLSAGVCSQDEAEQIEQVTHRLEVALVQHKMLVQVQKLYTLFNTLGMFIDKIHVNVEREVIVQPVQGLKEAKNRWLERLVKIQMQGWQISGGQCAPNGDAQHKQEIEKQINQVHECDFGIYWTNSQWESGWLDQESKWTRSDEALIGPKPKDHHEGCLAQSKRLFVGIDQFKEHFKKLCEGEEQLRILDPNNSYGMVLWEIDGVEQLYNQIKTSSALKGWSQFVKKVCTDQWISQMQLWQLQYQVCAMDVPSRAKSQTVKRI